VRATDALEAFDFSLIGNPAALNRIKPEMPVSITGMDGVHGVFLTLQPVTGQQRRADLPENIIEHEQIPAREQRRGLWTNVAPHKSTKLLHRVCF
jgi:hypothetical protein